jgi:SAM-dependent methyltransferase
VESNHIAKEMERTYDRYFASSGYRRRYPRPNEATLDYLLANGARDARSILDFGCGNGRYSRALLEQSSAELTAYDISALSLNEFEQDLCDTPYKERVNFVHDDLFALGKPASYDLILMLFGVLSHVGDRAARVRVLTTLRHLIRKDGRLILSVPSIYRRRPWELLKWALARRVGRATPPQDEPGNIYFTRQVHGHTLTFFYHLYKMKDLRAELREAGFAIRHCSAESLLPEWCVTRSGFLRQVDARLSALIPAVLGYGIRVLAVPV